MTLDKNITEALAKARSRAGMDVSAQVGEIQETGYEAVVPIDLAEAKRWFAALIYVQL